MNNQNGGGDGKSAAEIAFLFQRLALDLAQIQDPDLVLEVILQQGKKLLEASSAAALVAREADQPMHSVLVDLPPTASDLLSAAFNDLFTDVPSELLSGALIIDDLIDGNYPALESLEDLKVESCIVLPLSQRGILLGGLWFLYNHPHHLPETHLNWAVVLAGQAALALENARLVDVALRQATELGAFYVTAATVENKHDLDFLLNQIIDQTTTLLACRMGIIYLANEEDKVLESVVHRGIPGGFETITCPFGKGVAGKVAESWESTVVEECHDWEGMVQINKRNRKKVRVLCTPMIWHNRLIGVLDLAAEQDRRPFTETDMRLAKSVAYQAANALGIARLIESERRQYRMAEALQEASLVISHQVDLDEVLDRILEQVMYAFPCDAANFQRLEGNTARIIRSRGYDRFGMTSGAMSNLEVNVNKDPNLRRMMEGEVLILSNTVSDPSHSELSGWEWSKSRAGAPIKYGQDILGFINLDSATAGTFDTATAHLLSAFAAHAAAAMHKAELYRKLAEEHRRLQTLYKIEREVTVSLEPTTILTRLLEGALDALEGIFAQVFLMSKDEDELFKRGPKVGRFQDGEELAPHPQVLKLAEQSVRQFTPIQATLIYASGSYSVIAFPIAAGQHIWGVGLVWTKDEPESKDAWLEVFRAVGQQVGLALTNAEQHTQVQRRLAEMTILQRVVGAIASRLEVEAMLREVTEQLHTKLGFPAVQIYRRVSDELVLQEVSGPKPIVEKLSIERGITGRVARTGIPAFVEDVRKDPDYVAGLVGTKAELAVPIRLGEEIIGVLNIETSDPAEFDKGALELLMLLADQVSVALQNAMLYEQVQDSVMHLENQIRLRTKELELALEQAQAADRAKAEFVEDISHELRTPLTNIGLYLDLIDMGDGAHAEEYMATLRRETKRLSALIEQLLAISHLDTKQAELSPKPTDINSLLKVLQIDRERMIKEKGLDLNINMEEGLPQAYIDPAYIIQAMTNLLTNAMNYTPVGGKITLETQQCSWNNAPWVTVSVRDTGPGITEAEKRRIFDRFYRGLVGRASGVPGTGLGLSICKEIVERHGGRITVSSKVGAGSTFVLWLPVVDEAQSANEEKVFTEVNLKDSK